VGCLVVLIWYERLRNPTNSRKISRSRLEIGPSQPLYVRKESLRIFNQSQPFRLLYASDLHFKGERSRRVAEQIISAARGCAPDLILLGGDLVDTNAGLPRLTRTVAELSELAPTWAVAGNHDAMVGLPVVQSAVETGGGNWLENQSVLIGGRWPFFLDGKVTENVSANHPRVLCAHDPEVFPEAAECGYSLVLAGHLHGGQFVLMERAGRFVPASWFYRWNGLRFARSASTMLVSRGASDTLPLRWNCPREILLCELY
jgi:predicted MPP superfamily phosphohydrolase